MCYDSANRKTKAREILPEEDVWFWDGRLGRKKGDDGVGEGRGDGREERGGVEGAGIEEVGGICGVMEVSNGVLDTKTGVVFETLFGEVRLLTSAGFEDVGTEGKDI